MRSACGLISIVISKPRYHPWGQIHSTRIPRMAEVVLVWISKSYIGHFKLIVYSLCVIWCFHIRIVRGDECKWHWQKPWALYHFCSGDLATTFLLLFYDFATTFLRPGYDSLRPTTTFYDFLRFYYDFATTFSKYYDFLRLFPLSLYL